MEYWQPEANLSQEKLTSYWERQCRVEREKEGKSSRGNQKDIKMSDLDVFASEGNRCRQKPKELTSNVYQYEAIPQKYQTIQNQSSQLVKEQLERGTYVEASFCFNYGIWKFLKQQKIAKTTTTIWKCQDCSVKLVKQQIDQEKQYTVTLEGTNSEQRNLHAWADKRHQLTKLKKKKGDTALHPSVSAIFQRYQKKVGLVAGQKNSAVNKTNNDVDKEVPTGAEFIKMLQKEHPLLAKHFCPTIAQISNHRNTLPMLTKKRN